MLLSPGSGSPTFLGQMLKNYRRDHNLKQNELAQLLTIDVRTLRSYENGEHILDNMTELRRIALLLGFEPEQLGLTSSAFTPRSAGEINAIIDHVWSLIAQAHNLEARATIEQLIHHLMTSLSTEDRELLDCLARARYVAGYVISLNTHTSEVYRAMQHFQEMETVARLLDDESLLNVALTYQGDMLRREGNLDKAIVYLEAARDTTPRADTASQGNAIQLLARTYLQHGDLSDFERSMGKAEELTQAIGNSNITHGLYCLGTVYEEYGRGYGALGQLKKSMHYLDLAKQELLPSERWQTLLTTTRAVSLVRGGEFHAGVEMAIEAAHLCKKVGNLRCLERIYAIQQYLDRLSRYAGQESGILRDALYGPIGQWNMQS